MSELVRSLYSSHRYPALTHPAADPGRVAVTAKLAGLKQVADPAKAKVLEIGCAGGHHLLALAERSPEARFLGIDFSDLAVRQARESARVAGLANIEFAVADFAEWETEERYDYVIAHGIFSWVDRQRREILLGKASSWLADQGVLILSYNTLPGWSLKRDVTPVLRGLAGRGEEGTGGRELVAMAEQVRGWVDERTAYGRHLSWVLEEMVRKGEQVVPFDEGAPVCDPMYFGHVAQWAHEYGLMYLAESEISAQLPEGLDLAKLGGLQVYEADGVRFQQILDVLSGRTHRVSLWVKRETQLAPATEVSAVLSFAVARGDGALPEAEGAVAEWLACLEAKGEQVVEMQVLLEEAAARLGRAWEPAKDSQRIAAWVFAAARLGALELHADGEVRRASSDGISYEISPLNRHFAIQHRMVVDARLRTLRYPSGHLDLLGCWDGRRSKEELLGEAREKCPELDVERWMEHLRSRGILK